MLNSSYQLKSAECGWQAVLEDPAH